MIKSNHQHNYIAQCDPSLQCSKKYTSLFFCFFESTNLILASKFKLAEEMKCLCQTQYLIQLTSSFSLPYYLGNASMTWWTVVKADFLPQPTFHFRKAGSSSAASIASLGHGFIFAFLIIVRKNCIQGGEFRFDSEEKVEDGRWHRNLLFRKKRMRDWLSLHRWRRSRMEILKEVSWWRIIWSWASQCKVASQPMNCTVTSMQQSLIQTIGILDTMVPFLFFFLATGL